jgi:hypothetical protein
MREQSFCEAIRNFAMPPPHPRMAVYRNNIASALIYALRVRYPAVAGVMGRTAFSATAGSYALANLPRDPVLIFYGESFPDFLAGSEAGKELPWLADLARLESLWWRAYHAAEAEPLAASLLAGIPAEKLFDLVLRFHPSASHLSSPHPVGSIWEACKQGDDWRKAAQGSGERLFIVRPGAEIHVSRIGEASHAFLAQLMSGKPLGPVFEDLVATFPGFDLNRELTSLIQSNAIIGLSE